MSPKQFNFISCTDASPKIWICQKKCFKTDFGFENQLVDFCTSWPTITQRWTMNKTEWNWRVCSLNTVWLSVYIFVNYTWHLTTATQYNCQYAPRKPSEWYSKPRSLLPSVLPGLIFLNIKRFSYLIFWEKKFIIFTWLSQISLMRIRKSFQSKSILSDLIKSVFSSIMNLMDVKIFLQPSWESGESKSINWSIGNPLRRKCLYRGQVMLTRHKD